jgi:hypothetical protein
MAASRETQRSASREAGHDLGHFRLPYAIGLEKPVVSMHYATRSSLTASPATNLLVDLLLMLLID